MIIPKIDLASKQDLNLGNSYTYTITAGDRDKYAGFISTVADVITLSDGTNSVDVTVSAGDIISFDGSVTTIVGTLTNVIAFVTHANMS